MSAHRHRHNHHAYVPKALISQCDLVCDEFSEKYVEDIRNTLFRNQDGPSDVEQWFKKIAQWPDAVRCTNYRIKSRLISWKTGTNFEAQNLFFHTVDTSRLLPMSLADFRIQWYAHKETWAWVDSREKERGVHPRKTFQLLTLAGLMFPMLILRNMHDYGGADIPLVVTDWKSEDIDRAFDYWVELSKGRLSQAEQERKFHEVDNSWCHNIKPCFMEVDLLVRALLSDPTTGYVPRFIVFMSTAPNVKGRALYADPSYELPKSLWENFPTGCGSSSCEDKDCGFFDFSACRSLAAKSKMVRRDEFPKHIARCNVWMCTVEEPIQRTGHSNFKTCTRCAEVLYCSKEHQKVDWSLHRRVCEARLT